MVNKDEYIYIIAYRLHRHIVIRPSR